MERNDNNNCLMLTNPGISALKEEEIELELGLSVGGSCRRKEENFIRVKQGGDDLSKSGIVDVALRDEKHAIFLSAPTTLVDDVEQEMDPKTKKEIHALQRQGAKKKREEKQLRNAGFCRKNGGGCFNGGVLRGDNDNVLWLKAKDVQELDAEKRESKKSKREDSGSVNLNFGIEKTSTNFDSTSCPILSPVPPVLPMQYPSLNPQYGVPTNGFVYPNRNVVPEKKGNVASYRFEPFEALMEPGQKKWYESEQNGSGEGGNKKSESNGPSMCTSSGSDHRSSSLGGGSSVTRSHSCQSVAEQLNDSKANDSKIQSEHSATSHVIQSALVNNTTNHAEKIVISSIRTQSCLSKSKEETKCEAEPGSTDRHASSPNGNSTTSPLKDRNGDMGKPPKPHSIVSYPQMPCVSTTGNGPNGKTITGFLYRYTKSEVIIVCVCHGSSFTPAEFVQHAGGTDVSHPLRHITVIPSSF